MTEIEYRMIDMEGEAMPAPREDLARIRAREERERERARVREEREAEKARKRAEREAGLDLVKLNLGNGQTLTVTRARAKELKRALRDYLKRERQKIRELGITSDPDGPPWEREQPLEKPKFRNPRKRGFYTFD